jgi:hypothetical protein
MTPEPREREVRDDPPPFLGRWPRLYAAVIAYLAGLIALFYLFTRAFNRWARTLRTCEKIRGTRL